MTAVEFIEPLSHDEGVKNVTDLFRATYGEEPAGGMGRTGPCEPDRRTHRLQRGPVPADRTAAPHVHRAQAA